MGTGDILLGVTLRWTSIHPGGSSDTLSCFRNRVNLRPCGPPLAHVRPYLKIRYSDTPLTPLWQHQRCRVSVWYCLRQEHLLSSRASAFLLSRAVLRFEFFIDALHHFNGRSRFPCQTRENIWLISWLGMDGFAWIKVLAWDFSWSKPVDSWVACSGLPRT